ncbi:unnamed protein product [Clonostachys chloroleuca]|uniref:DUF7730 domain-containing protein n=1 Tax=Clonostachys chloroleuca TaxID=1926264 RepID=A0AA35Q8H8_9HYPO|nr:unnamed protein product [Clonostachys chloroleuca]
MRASLGRWFRWRIQRGAERNAETQQPAPPAPGEVFAPYISETSEAVPALPAERPRLLTPSSSRDDLCASAEDATAQSGFFRKLPFEIRRQILVEAFGGHTVHMDLSFGYPELPLDQLDDSFRHVSNHGNRNRDTTLEHRQETLRYNVNNAMPKRWIWRSSDCHRNPPWNSRSEIQPRYQDSAINAAEDRCRFGGVEGYFCQLWPGESPLKCSVGAMGWLLSCRKAQVPPNTSYLEGIDVLYGTNTIHSASKQMLLHLDKLLLPQRLANIRSVELVWFFKPYRTHSPQGPLDDLPTFYEFLAKIPATFPNVRSFYMALHGDITHMTDRNGRRVYMDDAESIEITDREVMSPIDAMVGKLRQLDDCTIALSSLEYERRRKRAVDAVDTVVYQVHLGGWQERHWRVRKGEMGYSQGYWVQLGHRELGRVHMCRFGEPNMDLDPPEDNVLFQPWYLPGEYRHLRM